MQDHLIAVLQAVAARGKGQIPAAGMIAKETGLTVVAVQEAFARAARMGREIVAGREYQQALA